METYEIAVELKTGQAIGFSASGWAINDPKGFVQIILPEKVVFFPVDVVVAITVPNLAQEEEPILAEVIALHEIPELEDEI